MKLFKIFALGVFLFMTSFAVHKYYISVSHINYIETQKAIQITQRIFIDDLQTELNSTLNKTNQIELATDREPNNIDSIYRTYLKENFKIDINATERKIKYLGKKYKDDMIIFYLEIPDVSEVNTIQIQNNTLYNSFSEQENIIKTNINNKQKSHVLTIKENHIFIKY